MRKIGTSEKLSSYSASASTSLKYVENFSNPYVKIILVCKVCNKEQSLRNSGNWKQHFLTHVSGQEKPHKCQQCPKSFIRADQLKKHISKHHPLDDEIKPKVKFEKQSNESQ